MKKTAIKKTAREKIIVSFDAKLKDLLVPIDSIKLWEGNPRYNDSAVPRLAKLFQINGVRSPVVAWSKNKVVYKGNTTLKALQALGSKFIPVLFQDFSSEAAAEAYGISDNKSSEFSEWDEDILLELMQSEEIKNSPATGFKESELSRMIQKQEESIIRDVSEYSLLKCIVMYHPEIKEDLKHYIEKTVARKFGEKVIIKF